MFLVGQVASPANDAAFRESLDGSLGRCHSLTCNREMYLAALAKGQAEARARASASASASANRKRKEATEASSPATKRLLRSASQVVAAAEAPVPVPLEAEGDAAVSPVPVPVDVEGDAAVATAPVIVPDKDVAVLVRSLVETYNIQTADDKVKPSHPYRTNENYILHAILETMDEDKMTNTTKMGVWRSLHGPCPYGKNNHAQPNVLQKLCAAGVVTKDPNRKMWYKVNV